MEDQHILTPAQIKLLAQYHYNTNPIENPEIDMFVCEDTADLHFINTVTGITIDIVRNNQM